MSHDLTHASFFSGVGGLDLGLERAGWRTVSFSEIDPYASAVLAERWPGIPNLGDIVRLDWRDTDDGPRLPDDAGWNKGRWRGTASRDDWTAATLWSGGFPCQDLSVAGKRAGFADGTRSSLAFAFLTLVERHRPPAILLENVPGLLSSNAGRDMGRLLSEMAELGYGMAWRILDARHFGVPQRRRRVFIVGLRSGPDDPEGHLAAERAAEILAVGTRCDRHPPTGVKAKKNIAARTGGSTDEPRFWNATAQFGKWERGDDAGTLSQRDYKSPNHLIGPAPDASRVRTVDGLARRLDGSDDVAATLNSGGNDGGFRTEVIRSGARDQNGSLPPEVWREEAVAPTINNFDVGDARTATAVVGSGTNEVPLLPLGLDSHRYRCCGNGIVAPVAKWIGLRLRLWAEHD